MFHIYYVDLNITSMNVKFQWCNLSPEEKITYEERANKLNDVNFPQWRQETFKVSLPPVGSEFTWECGWDNCDWKFEDQLDCLDHAIADQYGHVQVFFAAISPSGIIIILF